MLATCVWLCLVLATCDFSKVILFKGANLNIETELPTVAHAPQFQHKKYRKGDLEFEASFSSTQHAGGQPAWAETISISTHNQKEKNKELS